MIKWLSNIYFRFKYPDQLRDACWDHSKAKSSILGNQELVYKQWIEKIGTKHATSDSAVLVNEVARDMLLILSDNPNLHHEVAVRLIRGPLGIDFGRKIIENDSVLIELLRRFQEQDYKDEAFTRSYLDHRADVIRMFSQLTLIQNEFATTDELLNLLNTGVTDEVKNAANLALRKTDVLSHLLDE